MNTCLEIAALSGLERMDDQAIFLHKRDVLCFMVVRNESMRLPFFFDYYRSQGISKFFVVDNDSTDTTLSYLLEQPNTYVWHTKQAYREHKQGIGWLELLVKAYGNNRWCLIVDADEILYYPDCENKTIPELCHQLEKQGKDTLQVTLLDMYSSTSIKETPYQRGDSFLKYFSYFDKKFYHHKQGIKKTYYWGGLRQRIFGDMVNGKTKLYCLTKFPLFRYQPTMSLFPGLHYLKNTKVATTRGCLLHFKYFPYFKEHVIEATQRKQYWQGAAEYHKYSKLIARNDNINLYDERYSVKFRDSQQLIEMGIMHRGGFSERLARWMGVGEELIYNSVSLAKACINKLMPVH
ncbi:MAG TPA: hypothetical protein DDZ80_19925 [Cyanobacteria bacterium UBA8803]|nr:hypothetical protein [Cyanobacteria bacterium UBA9273]HBL60634.1 hypothetical protein [Cyanobacteria bacterium UBA8803]